MSALLWALVALPLTVGTLLAVVGRPADRYAPGVAVGTAVGALGLAVAVAFGHPRVEAPLLEGLPAGLAVDGLSGLMVVTVTAVTAAVLLFGVADIGPGEARARFFGLMLLFAGAMLTTVTATTLPVLLMAWEVMGATSWALIGHWWRDPERGDAANTAFLTTRAADLGLYLAAGAAVASGQSGSLAELPGAADPWQALITAGVIVAALGKSAQLPFSFWLSRAMRGPSPVSALLHSATMVVAGAYLLLRLEPLLARSGWGGPLVAWTGAVTAVLLGLVAVAQTDLKQLLAASTCAQIGFMVLAAGTGAVTGGTLQLIAHAAAKSLAFLVAGAWLTSLGTKALPALHGAARRHRTAGIAFTVAALALAGIPPLSLWAAKDVLLAEALEDSTALYVVGLAGAVISAVYSAKALWFVWQPAPAADRHREEPLPLATRLPLVILAVACVALTATSFPPVREAVGRVLGGEAQPGPRTWEFALSGVLAVVVSAVVWIRGPHLRALAVQTQWLHLETAAHALLVRPVMRLADALAAFDDRVLDRAVDGTARGSVRLARWTDTQVERLVDGAVEGVAGGARALGRLARRPQTGQLHQYLAQAVAAFTVLAVVLVLVR
ncbi:NADH:ubiquinone oxidoreductase subunit 5 (chain L)/multisubunit Na+/H+ antiporter, MnhA subunit [Streptomyces lincolnensis]|uniref:NADH:ubiquinone oxidoreductase subunit 5 (Chain L)/multisubunit Na+/H+ antiporter, MnhA subunit n=1 Tax=Streptomyces lincolnensis TaxID=1915 RepID=A0A1B1MLR8_STRLN|nr:proton-conducting transporter membrane subunit [Streptomyces lincolnensis]ANS69528.1 NADH:ubiquinone oxidoreductase subunit 5 (chain L)/multisubunit Na+/H+ antiporter, MnhA subunit [Streptomyces lincolnensis]AXG58447.1 NADH:ubiquinone oxidoreductase subunit 5 (chain L)/multisubunit Na+/H+ antiporter, MnhA subunit [Streptomyces lincolnensis]QMV11095.1 NADH-quinone oxidoreductase subunit L [Streptomyces lincolnensis]